MKFKTHSKLAKTNRKGFTLVELMVVVVIVTVLATLVFLGSTRMKKATYRTVSAENLRKLQLANAIYASNNNGRFVSTFAQNDRGKVASLWDRNSEFLDYYVGATQPTRGNSQESRVSPKHLDPIAYNAKKNGYDTLKASYGMISKENYKSGNKEVDSAYRKTQMSTPSNTAAFVTAVNWLVQYSGRNGWNGEEGKINAPRIAYRHNNKALVAFYDGHVEQMTQDDMKELDRRGGKRNSFWTAGGRP